MYYNLEHFHDVCMNVRSMMYECKINEVLCKVEVTYSIIVHTDGSKEENFICNVFVQLCTASDGQTTRCSDTTKAKLGVEKLPNGRQLLAST